MRLQFGGTMENDCASLAIFAIKFFKIFQIGFRNFVYASKVHFLIYYHASRVIDLSV